MNTDDNKNKVRKCLDCNGKLTLKNEAIQYVKKKDSKAIYKYNRGYHKECWSKVQSSQILNRRASKNPENFLTCNDCDRVFSKTKRGRFLAYNTECPFCDSSNIESF